MTNKEYLEMELQLSVQKFGENDPVTLNLKPQLRKIEERSGVATLEAERRLSFCNFKQAFAGRSSLRSSSLHLHGPRNSLASLSA
jgi:hypothetical protein